MEIKCGIDIIEVDRVRKSIEDLGDKFLNKIYTNKEIEYCINKKEMKYQHFAARFAAKEAIFKAMSGKLKDKYEISWKNVQIVNDKRGRPKVEFINCSYNEIIEDIDISLSHIKEYAVANCIISYK